MDMGLKPGRLRYNPSIISFLEAEACADFIPAYNLKKRTGFA